MFAPRGWFSRKFPRRVYRTIERSPLFDSNYYRFHHLRGMARLRDPLWHFVNSGWKKGFSPSEEFDSSYYTMKNDDVRVAQLNPLFHFLEYGKGERRLPLRSALEAQQEVTPEASPLRYFITPAGGQRRVSLLLDTATRANEAFPIGSILRLAAQYAMSRKATLRILYRPGSLDHSELSLQISELDKSLQTALEITEVPTTLTYSDIPFFDEEESIATSWSSALALRFSTPEANSYALPRDSTGEMLTKNDSWLRHQLVSSALSVPQESPPELQELLLPAVDTNSGGIAALVDCDLYPLAYGVLIESLSQFVLNLPVSIPLRPISFVGKTGSRFAFAEEFKVNLVSGPTNSLTRVPTSLVVIMSGASDPVPHALSERGMAVIHACPEGAPASSNTAADNKLTQAPLTASGITKALQDFFS